MGSRSLPRPLRIAVLECDTGLPGALARYGRYGTISGAFLRAGAAACGLDGQADLDVTVWDVVQESATYPRVEDVDGVFLTGSKFNAFDDTPWVLRLVDYVKDVLAQRRVRLVGVCFGHQIIGRAMGAPVGRSEGGAWEVSVCDVQLTAEGTKVFGGRESLSLFQMHKDTVYEYPAGVEPLGSSESCLVQGMFVRNRIITVQGHPEFTEEILREILETRHSQGIFDDEIYEGAMGRVGRKHDGLLVAKRFIEFLID
ncbi:MAG: hypothetical protein LQ351_002668 [Letrouitia transgressa]|nr:MAG: hypothetical protein LQ351_002668 [Letrouitia transgressa]